MQIFGRDRYSSQPRSQHVTRGDAVKFTYPRHGVYGAPQVERRGIVESADGVLTIAFDRECREQHQRDYSSFAPHLIRSFEKL